MRLTRRSPREALSEAVIAALVTEATETGRTQIFSDSRCTALRLVVAPLTDPRWLFFCYNKDGRLEKGSIGRYPRIGVEEAREKAWRLRLQVKGIARPRHSIRYITLEKLLILYENSHETPVDWGRQKDKIVYALKPFVFRPWAKIDPKELQEYIDNYPSPGNMRKVRQAVRAIVAWGQENGVARMSTKTLTPKKARRAIRRRS
jgi:hypothetical protein